jgi:hypothetical protein
MPLIEKHAPGSFCWAELVTSNAVSAKAFYSGLFGWETRDIPASPGHFYTFFLLNGRQTGAMCESKDQPPHWTAYFAVESADAAAAKAVELGGKVLAGPFDVGEAGRMAALTDPDGTAFAVWQARANIGSQIIGEPGTLSWPELVTRNTAGAKVFYTGLLGWSLDESPQYTEWTVEGRPIGGMLRMDEKWGNLPPHWTIYVLVADCDATARKAAELGGKICLDPTDMPNVGLFSILIDPQGVYFSVIQLA